MRGGSDLSQRLSAIRQKVARAAQRAGRSANEIQLLAATKTRTVEEINRAIEAGVALIGENRAQEAQAKFPELQPVKRHFIGHLQTNKVKAVLELFDCIESVDRMKLASVINQEAEKLGRSAPVFIEVNVGQEASKRGVMPCEALAFARSVARMEFLSVEGLMAMPPFADDPEAARPYFGQMRDLYNEFRALPGVQARHLSMGTSQDFEVAIEEGSTLIRLGAALFGPRD